MTIGIAIIGSGIFAKEQHLPAIEACKIFELKAIYSRSLKSAKSLSDDINEVDLYSDDSEGFTKLLDREDIKGVIIALPITAQPQYIRQALEAGKHVLSEKPIAADSKTAIELISWYEEDIMPIGITWSVAENFRFLESFEYAAHKVKDMGKILGFRVKVYSMVENGWKYFETSWRKTPSYQGGFLLDGGVHMIAGTRLLLGATISQLPEQVSCFSTQLQEYLPPVDTVDAIWRLNTGVSGTFSVSFGTTFKGSEYAVACEKGTVTVTRGLITVVQDGKEEKKDFPDEGSGVKQEVKAWAEALESGKKNGKQSPIEALRDVQVLEMMLRSGEQNGEVIHGKDILQ